MSELDLIAPRPAEIAEPAGLDHAHRSLWSDVRRQFMRHPGALVGMVVLIAIVLIVLVGPYVWTVSPDRINPRVANRGMSLDHPLGTDNLGRDLFAQVMAGGRVSLAVGISAM